MRTPGASVRVVPAPTELDFRGASELVQRVDELLRSTRPGRVEIALDATVFIDAAGLRALLACRQLAGNVDLELVCVRPSASVRRLAGLFDEIEALIEEDT